MAIRPYRIMCCISILNWYEIDAEQNFRAYVRQKAKN